jgi:hypothetical protein
MVCGSFTPTSKDEQGETWIDFAGVLHIRDQVVEWTFCNSCFTGCGRGTYDINIALAGGVGDMKGIQELDLCYSDDWNHEQRLGTFVGLTTGIYDRFFLNAKYEARGIGGFALTALNMDFKSHRDDPRMRFNGLWRSALDNKDETESATWSDVKSMYR